MHTPFENNAIFWIEVEKVRPNPYQPRREFDEERLNDLAESIRTYGILQPLTVTRKEIFHDGVGMVVEYELIAGERRLRASKIAGLSHIPAIIRTAEQSDKVKLELAIIENLQREDLNAVERALAFQQLAAEFGFKHAEIAKKVGRSREFVSNTIRLLGLPEEILQALREGKLTEGHSRPLLMLKDRPEEQTILFKEIVYKKLNVRDTEKIARKIAQDKVRNKKHLIDPKVRSLEQQLSDRLGTRVQIELKEVGGKIVINFFSDEDIQSILDLITAGSALEPNAPNDLLERYISNKVDDSPINMIREEIDRAPSSEPVFASVSLERTADTQRAPEELPHAFVREQTVREEAHSPVQEVPREIETEEEVVSSDPLPDTEVDTTVVVALEDTHEADSVPEIEKIREEPQEIKAPVRREEDESLYSISNFTI